MLARFLALLIGTLALASVRGQFDAMGDAPVAEKLWLMAAYFAVLTNLGVAGLMFAVARGWRMPGGVAAAVLVAVSIVAVAYALPGINGVPNLGAASAWAERGLHIGVPVAVFLWWLGFADKATAWSDLPRLMLWPAIYSGYVLVRRYLFGFEVDLWPEGDLLRMVEFVSGLAGYLLAFVVVGFGG